LTNELKPSPPPQTLLGLVTQSPPARGRQAQRASVEKATKTLVLALNISPCIPVLFLPQLVDGQVLVLLVFPPSISSEVLTADDSPQAPFFVQLPLRCELQKPSAAGNGETRAHACGKNHQYLNAKTYFITSNIAEGSLNDSGKILRILRRYSKHSSTFSEDLSKIDFTLANYFTMYFKMQCCDVCSYLQTLLPLICQQLLSVEFQGIFWIKQAHKNV